MSQLLAVIPGMIGGGAAGGSTLGNLAMIGTAAGTAVGAVSQLKAGQYAKAAGDAANEAAQLRSKQMFEEGQERSSRMREDNARRMAAIRARMAGGGTRIGGSGLDYMSEAAARMEMRVQDAFRQSTIGASNELYSGRIAQFEGKQQQSASAMRGFGTLLEGTSAYYGQGVKWGKFNPYSKR